MAKARNEFLEGKYKGKVFVKRMDGKISVLTGFFKQIIFDKTNIKDIEVITQDKSKDVGSSVARGLAGGILLGPVGLLAGAWKIKKWMRWSNPPLAVSESKEVGNEQNIN